MIIIGAGLSGLLTGYLLKKEGIPFKILEARNRVGGRINTIYRPGEAPTEMGATWFTNQHQNLKALLAELEIEYFEQEIGSKVFYQPNPNSPVQQLEIPKDSPSYRIAGGTSNLINTLAQNFDDSELILNQTVKQITIDEDSILVKADNEFTGQLVVLSLPPKLWSSNIEFLPALSAQLFNVALNTHTWMEDSIKVSLTFSSPFWQEEKIPSTLFSSAGPVTEFYDHCNIEKSQFALCGFINSSFKNLNEIDRKFMVLDQLKAIYGVRIDECLHYEESVWSQENYTFQASENLIYPHQNNGHPIFQQNAFNDRLLFSSSESAAQFSGYMEGAVIAALETTKKILALQKLR